MEWIAVVWSLRLVRGAIWDENAVLGSKHIMAFGGATMSYALRPKICQWIVKVLSGASDRAGLICCGLSPNIEVRI